MPEEDNGKPAVPEEVKYGPEWHAAVEPEWRLCQVWARLAEIESHLEKLEKIDCIQPDGIGNSISALRRRVRSATNTCRNISLRHSAYKRRVSGLMTEGEKRDYDLRQTLKPGGRPPEKAPT